MNANARMRSLVLACLTATGMLITAATANADGGSARATSAAAASDVDILDNHWKLKHKGSIVARAHYDDDADDLWVTDTEKDGHSVVAVTWQKNHYKNRYRLWNSAGHGNQRGVDMAWAGGENAKLRVRLCLGEWAPRPSHRLIFACGVTHKFRG